MDDDLQKRANGAATAIFVVGGMMAIIGLIAILFNVQFLKGLGVGIWSVIEGGVFLYLGFLVKRGSVTALWIAIVLFALETLFSVGAMIRIKMASAGGGIFVRLYLLYCMYRGFGAVGKSEAPGMGPSVRPVPQQIPARTPSQTKLSIEAEKRRMEMSTLTQTRMSKPSPLPGDLRRFDVSSKDAISTASSSLRFVAFRCEIGQNGLKAIYGNGKTRELEWLNVSSILVRQLPPDRPWEGRIFLDILPMTAPGFPVSPVRIFASTYVNYAALPGGQAASSTENIRRLAAHIASQNPALILDAHSGPFIHLNKPPHRLTLAQFAEYDNRFPNA